MKLTNHELLLYTNDDYRENVLKSSNSKDVVKDIMEELEWNYNHH